MTRINIGLFALGALLVLAPASAFSDPITIVSETSGGDPGESPSIVSTWFVASWTTTNAYSDVSIAATVGCYSVPCSLGINAYLTTAIGPTETAADQIATSAISIDVLGPQQDTFFSGLSLAPGTYYLLLRGDAFSDAIYWFAPYEGQGGATATDTGVTYNGDYLSSDNLYGYPMDDANPPASTWFYAGDRGLNFEVTGDSTVPEPSSISLVLIGMAGGLYLFRRRLTA
jgi:hypothetical protein